MQLLLALLACRGEEPPNTVAPPPTDIWTVPDEGVYTDLHTVPGAGAPVDVLVAVDPDPVSQTTFEEEVLPSLLHGLESVNVSWRVAVTSTALGDLTETAYLVPGGVDGGRWLSEEDRDDPVLDWTGFPDAPPLGATGATWLTVNGNPYDFHRPDATLLLVLSGLDATPEEILPFEEWAAWVTAEGAVVSALLSEGIEIALVVVSSGGILGSPYGDLGAWARAVGELPSAAPDSFALSRLPEEIRQVVVEDPGGATFELMEVTGEPPEGDWVYVPGTNAVSLTRYVPANGARVILTYEARE
jgi:hypothetical protein